MPSNHTPNPYTAQRQFELDPAKNQPELIEANKRSCEADALREIEARMGNTLADYIPQPHWTEERAEVSDALIYTLTMQLLFKP